MDRAAIRRWLGWTPDQARAQPVLTSIRIGSIWAVATWLLIDRTPAGLLLFLVLGNLLFGPLMVWVSIRRTGPHDQR